MNWFIVAWDIVSRYLISLIEITLNVNWSGSYICLEPGQITLISMGLIRYPYVHISGSLEPIPTKFELCVFFIYIIILHQYMVFNTLKCQKTNKTKKKEKKKKTLFCDVITFDWFTSRTDTPSAQHFHPIT